MDISHAHLKAQGVLKQRNGLAVLSVILSIVLLISLAVAASREREVVLMPIAHSPLAISSSGVSRDYMELVTRDTALMALNRSPETMKYWMETLLNIAAPSARGALKRDLMKIINEQQGSQISQYFTLDTIRVDPEKLESEVSGVLHTIAGSKEVSQQRRRFRFNWQYVGLSLQLAGFGMIENKEPEL